MSILRTSVIRLELRFAAACMASRKAWHSDAQEKLYRLKEPNHIDRVFRFALHFLREDSTNTIVRTAKNEAWTDVRKNVCQESTLADLHEAIHGTAFGLYATDVKQLSSYGRPSWVESSANQPDGVTVWTTVVFVTDSGGDEDYMKHIARDASTPNLFLWLFALLCLLHLYRCIVRRSLTFADSLCETLYSKMSARMGYWSMFAKTIDCSHDQLKAVYTEWVQAFGVVEADKYAKKMPPQPISGR